MPTMKTIERLYLKYHPLISHPSLSQRKILVLFVVGFCDKDGSDFIMK